MEPPRDLLLTLLQYPDHSFNEDEILLLWKYLSPRIEDLTTVEGRHVQVLRPGTVDRASGPDVTDAALRLDGVRRVGDVEIHRQTSDWYAHEHHRNEAFNTVILHVVLAGENETVRRCDDRWIDTLVLETHLPYLKSMLRAELGPSVEERRRRVKRPCYRVDPEESEFWESLEKIGNAWMTKRAAQFRDAPGDRFIRELIGALGYSRNHEPFDRLARRIRFDRFRKWVRGTTTTRSLEGLLLGLGGWLSDDENSFNRSIRRRVKSWRRDWPGLSKRVDSEQWVRSGVRPHVRPYRRWIAFGWATSRVLSETENWSDWCLDVLLPLLTNEGLSGVRGRLRETFRLPSVNYWHRHYSLRDDSHSSVPAPVGTGWFDPLVINVIFPYLYYISIRRGDESIRKLLKEQLHVMNPGLENRRTRRLTQQWGFESGSFEWKNGLQQQGAVHLYKEGCRKDRCGECPLRNEANAPEDTLFEKSR